MTPPTAAARRPPAAGHSQASSGVPKTPSNTSVVIGAPSVRPPDLVDSGSDVGVFGWNAGGERPCQSTTKVPSTSTAGTRAAADAARRAGRNGRAYRHNAVTANTPSTHALDCRTNTSTASVTADPISSVRPSARRHSSHAASVSAHAAFSGSTYAVLVST